MLLFVACFNFLSSRVRSQTLNPSKEPPLTAQPSPSSTTSSSSYESKLMPSIQLGPQPSAKPTLSPLPTTTKAPTTSPTRSPKPSVSPTKSVAPTPNPTAEPTKSNSPTVAPTMSPAPTPVPSEMPSNHPTMTTATEDKSRFRQRFLVASVTTFFNDTQIEAFETVIEGYTVLFVPIPENARYIETVCEYILGVNLVEDNQTFNEVDYTVSYYSKSADVTNFTYLFTDYVNSNLQEFAIDLQKADVPVLEAQEVTKRQIQSPAPSNSPQPSSGPSPKPSISFKPSYTPSVAPTSKPTPQPKPTLSPTMNELSLAPTKAPVVVNEKTLNVGAISAIVVLGGVGVLVGLLCYYLSWQKRQRQHLTDDGRLPPRVSGERNRNAQRPDEWPPSARETDADATQNLIMSPTESFLTKQSLLSAGQSGFSEESGDEYDRTQVLQDEFDKYKDQNLELFRDDVEGKVTGMEGVMSAAVTMAHMVDDNATLDDTELRWGCSPNCSGIEIEASALYEVSDWLKRNEAAPMERRRSFMQEILNKMVSSVKNGVLNADDGSRTIHESAALLGLQLAEALPLTTVIVSGMRKTATADDLTSAFREIGDIDVAAVASGNRGFGIVRFRRQKSVERAMRRYTTGEIVIQDVAIQLKILLPGGFVDSFPASEIND